jgi:mitochondrial enoyl-[acyl-carrier protein] reductase / trans-2-enoyl-CoA reductase
MSELSTHKKLSYSRFGSPEEVLECIPGELPTPRKGEALIRMCFANINPSDLGMIGGSYGKLLNLPAIAGREGVGTIVEIPESTSTLAVGDLVRIPEGTGAWQSHCIVPCEDLLKIPDGISPEQAATLFINPPTALMLLESFVDLKPGDWIIQNAANSSVGTWVIQLAKAKGLKTINVVRRASLEGELKAFGADVVIEDNNDYPKAIKDLTGGAKPRLALNSVGGESVIRQVKCLDDGGVCVTFGGMVGDQVRFPTRFLIFNDVKLCGFWMDKWTRTHSREEVAQLYQRVFSFVLVNNLSTPVQSVYQLSEFAEALAEFSKPRMGKILFKGS